VIVTTIDSIDAFERVRGAWEAVHAQDPESTVFTSWPWFRGWLQGTPCPWTILALRPDRGGEPVAFFPIGRQAKKRKGLVFLEIFLGGNTLSDHTGFICLPEYQEEAVAAFTGHLQNKVKWDVFRLKDVFDRKVEALTEAFPVREFDVQRADGQACHYIPLPESWESYLQDVIGRRPRQQFRQYHRDFSREEYRVEVADQARFEEYLAILLDLHRQRWPQKSETSLQMEKLLLRSCFQAGALYLPVLFYLDQPIAAVADFMDQKNATLGGFMSGWDLRFERLSPAKRLQSYVISHAIEKGYTCYDFLRGDESYKQETYGSVIRYNQDIVIHRKSWKRSFERLIGRWASS
jgi:CelD/BcsL family acetyltransferase involved in cellulose biosynthesis